MTMVQPTAQRRARRQRRQFTLFVVVTTTLILQNAAIRTVHADTSVTTGTSQHHQQQQPQSQQQQRILEDAAAAEEVNDDDDDDDDSSGDDDLFSWTSYAEQTYWSSSNNGNSFWNNFTNTMTETDPNIDAAKDVSVDAVVASLYFNALAFVCLMIFYEILRHFLPAVYSSKKRLHVIHNTQSTGGGDGDAATTPVRANTNTTTERETAAAAGISDNNNDNNNDDGEDDDDELELPDERPLDWIRPVLGVPWHKVREMVGLDGYFFLRYIRMNVRITAISTFWLYLILVPVYYFGGNEATNLTSGWYRISAANLSAQSNLMWVPCIVLYFFTGFIFFVIQQEYEHYFNIRQDFLAKGSTHVHPQHHYSVVVENIPDIYQSDVALAKYFESLFPDSVHSAVVVLNVPDLIEYSNKCMRTCRRLEKSIAYLHATGRRPTHNVGRARIRLLGIIDMQPLNCPTTTTSLPNCFDDDSDSDNDDNDHEHHQHASSKSAYIQMSDESNTAKAMMDGSASPTTTDTHKEPPPVPIYQSQRPPRGTRVDSISYYTQELAAHSRTLFRMQQKKIKIANDGAQQLHNEHLLRMSAAAANTESNGTTTGTRNFDLLRNPFWLDQIFLEATHVADQILDDSEWDNALMTPPTFDEMYDPTRTVQNKPIPSNITEISTNTHTTTTDYGSISPTNNNNNNVTNDTTNDNNTGISNTNTNRRVRLMRDDEDSVPTPRLQYDERTDDSDFLHVTTQDQYQQNHSAPFTTDQYRTWIRRWLGRLGLDFIVFCIRYVSEQWDVSCRRPTSCFGGKMKDGDIGRKDANIMSRTGFVTFLDLASTTTAASAPLNSNRSNISGGPIEAALAPEPREIIWANAHVSKNLMLRRERFANFVLALGVILWSFPLAAIQAFAKAENLAQIPGMEWIFQINNGYFTTLVNGYLPVVALLGLILILPVIFEYIAVKYERRKTLSDVQASMLGRYFYYQLANIYVSVTAGSILRSMAEIIESPSSILKLLGKSIPLMVGYFIALLVTKILAGLPMVFLRFGALMRMLLLLILSDDKKLTQRELDAIYRLENVQYGWEFPTQLLTVVIVFTYAVICPIILPFGLLYFMGALMVYKKQVLYVYSPVYESGGAMFPLAVQRSLFGLVCAQMTFWGYVVFRGCYYQPVFLFPLPVLTIFGMNHLYKTYAVPSEKLSLERARHCDRRSSVEQQRKAFREEKDDENHCLGSEHIASFRQESGLRNLFDHGVAARRNHFDTSKYRQPVLTEVATEPWLYRRGQREDAETLEVRAQLRQINRYIVSLSDSERKKQHIDFGSPL